ncbi:MAG: hypothetical protein JW966_06670 [Anaerolineae bacterium]|nr:hypothetical protein [Anaerolineae bacterium]
MKRTLILSVILMMVLGMVNISLAAPLRQDDCQPLVFGETVTGDITNDTPAVCFVLEPTLGQQFDVEMRAVDGDLDTVVRVLSTAQIILASNDNADDTTTDSRITNYMAMLPGPLTILATRAGGADGTTSGTFELRAGLFAESIEPADADALPVALDEPVEGEISDAASRVFYELPVDEEALLMVYADAADDALTPYVAVHRISGKFSAMLADAEASEAGGTVALGPLVLRPGLYRFEVSRAGDAGEGAFSFSVVEPVLAADQMVLTYGEMVVGLFEEAPDALTFTFDGAAGDVVGLEMAPAIGLSEPMRAGLEVARLDDGEPVVLVSSQDPTAPTIGVLLLEENALYRVTASALLGQGAFSLNLKLWQTGGVPYDVPTSEFVAGETITGEIGLLDYAHIYRVDIEAGSEIDLIMQNASGDLDPFLELVQVLPDGARKDVAQNDNRTAFSTNAGITNLYMVEGGTFEIKATRSEQEHGATTGSYELTLTVLSPDEVPERPPLRPVPAAGGHSTWTVLLYMGADNDIEAPIYSDYNELEAVGSSDEVRFVVQMDRSIGYSRAGGNWFGSRRWAVGQDYNMYSIGSPFIEDLGVIDSGIPETLEDFLIWGIDNYPADHYAVVLNDHGGGWRGAVVDDDTGHILSVPDIAQALVNAGAKTESGTIDVLAFSACSMGAIEVIDGLSGAADWVVGSAKMVDFSSFDFIDLAERLIANPDADPVEFANLFTLSFDASHADASASYMMATYDSAHVPALMAALENFADVIEEDPARWDEIIDIYIKTFAYVGDNYADLGHLAENLVADSDDEGFVAAAEMVLAALDDTIVLYESSPSGEIASGLSIRLPRYKQIPERYAELLDNPFWARWAELVNTMNG